MQQGSFVRGKGGGGLVGEVGVGWGGGGWKVVQIVTSSPSHGIIYSAIQPNQEP